MIVVASQHKNPYGMLVSAVSIKLRRNAARCSLTTCGARFFDVARAGDACRAGARVHNSLSGVAVFSIVL